MRILIASECLRTGGAQVFALRLAKALQERGHIVYFFYHYQDYIHLNLVHKIFPEVKLLSPNLPFVFDWLLRKADRLLYKLRIDIQLRHQLVLQYITYFIKKYQIEVVHSNMFQSDYVFANALQTVNLPLIITMHGSYESFLLMDISKSGERYIKFKQKLQKTIARTHAIAYLTDKNLEVFKHSEFLTEDKYQHIKFEKIYNGFQGVYDNPLQKQDLNIPKDHVVFGFVARGIPEKGWEIAINAFLKLNTTKASLLLVGFSKYVEELMRKYQTHDNIIFLGERGNPLDVIHTFDVGLLPSYYGESLPNVIVEYLFCGKPVITTNVGESARMITTDKGEVAGYIINQQEPEKIQKKLVEALDNCITNQEGLFRKSNLSKNCFEKFEMDTCIKKYEKLYDDALNHNVIKGTEGLK